MSVVAMGSSARIRAFALAGARAVVAEDDGVVLAAWETLDDDVDLLVLTPDAAAALGSRLATRPRLLWVVLP